MHNKKGMKIGIICFVIIFILVVVFTIISFKTKKENPNENSSITTNENTQTGTTKTSMSNQKITIKDLLNYKEAPESDFYTASSSDGGLIITGYEGNDEILVIPEIIKGKKVTEVNAIFTNDTKVKAVKFPDTVTTISAGMFINNENIQTVILGDGLKVLPKNTFLYSSVSEVKIGKNLSEIKDLSFPNCKNLKQIYIPENVKTIDITAFFGCTSLVIQGKSNSSAEEFVKQAKEAEIYKNTKITFEEK